MQCCRGVSIKTAPQDLEPLRAQGKPPQPQGHGYALGPLQKMCQWINMLKVFLAMPDYIMSSSQQHPHPLHTVSSALLSPPVPLVCQNCFKTNWKSLPMKFLLQLLHEPPSLGLPVTVRCPQCSKPNKNSSSAWGLPLPPLFTIWFRDYHHNRQ